MSERPAVEERPSDTFSTRVFWVWGMLGAAAVCTVGLIFWPCTRGCLTGDSGIPWAIASNYRPLPCSPGATSDDPRNLCTLEEAKRV